MAKCVIVTRLFTLIDGDTLPQRVRLGAATRAISQVKRDFLNANLMLPRCLLLI